MENEEYIKQDQCSDTMLELQNNHEEIMSLKRKMREWRERYSKENRS